MVFYWQQYKKQLMAVLCLFLVVGVVWYGWQQRQMQYRIEASVMYEHMRTALKTDVQPHRALQMADALIRDYPRTPYAAFSALIKAKYAAEAHHSGQAKKALDWVIQHATDPTLVAISRLRKARILLMEHQEQAAMRVCAPITSGVFRSAFTVISNHLHEAASGYDHSF